VWWRATRNGVRECTRNAVLAAAQLGIRSRALPLIGAGTGGLTEEHSRAAIEAGLADFPAAAGESGEAVEVLVVSYQRAPQRTT
jgi:O-acetyl-ADP-ribose deacetylase (regulator of RNase III)